MEDLSYAIGSGAQQAGVARLLTTLDQSALKENEQWQIAGVKGLKKGLEKNDALTPDLKQMLEDMQEGIKKSRL